MKSKLEISEFISIIADILTVISIIGVYFNNDNMLIYIVIVILLLVSDIFLFLHSRKIKKQNMSINKENLEMKELLQSLRDNVFMGQMAAHTFMQYLPYKKDENKNKKFNYFSVNCYINIIYDEVNLEQDMFDVEYKWEYRGRNISASPLKYMSFRIAGDSMIRDNTKLKLKAKIKVDNKSVDVSAIVIEDNLRIKLIQVDFGDYAIRPDMDFELKLEYIWEKSYNKFGDMFSFDLTNHPDGKSESMQIQIKTHQNIMGYVMVFIKDIKGKELQNNEIMNKLDIIKIEKDKCAISYSLNEYSCNNQACFIKILPPTS